MYLLDTNHCSRIIFGDPVIAEQLSLHSSQGIATNAIVRGELIYMAYKSNQRSTNLPKIIAFLGTINFYPINAAVADQYGGLKNAIIDHFGPKEQAKRRSFTIQNLGFSDNDLWIAATALHYQLTVVSSDGDFQRIQQVQSFSLESWV